MVEIKNKSIQRANQEKQVFQKQIDKLIEELREKSDSESFEDEKEKLLNVEKALELGRVKENLKNLKLDLQAKEDEN